MSNFQIIIPRRVYQKNAQYISPTGLWHMYSNMLPWNPSRHHRRAHRHECKPQVTLVSNSLSWSSTACLFLSLSPISYFWLNCVPSGISFPGFHFSQASFPRHLPITCDFLNSDTACVDGVMYAWSPFVVRSDWSLVIFSHS